MKRNLYALTFALWCGITNAAELLVPEQFDVLHVNGLPQATSFQRDKVVKLNVGRNDIEMEFNQIYDAEYGDSHDRIRSAPFIVVITVAAENEQWQVQAESPATRREAIRYSKNPVYRLQKIASDGASHNAEVKPVAEKTDQNDALTQLQFWWSQASVEQRQAFLQTILSKP